MGPGPSSTHALSYAGVSSPTPRAAPHPVAKGLIGGEAQERLPVGWGLGHWSG